MKYWAVLLISVLVLGGLVVAGGFTWWLFRMNSTGMTVSTDAYIIVGAIVFSLAGLVLLVALLSRLRAGR